MADQIKYSNLVARNEEGLESFLFKDFGQNQKGAIDKVRESLKEEYGWVSPYEYYYGSPDSDQSQVQKTSLTPPFTPQALGLSDENEDLFADVEAADRENIPDWFWVDSFCNWCYIKVSTKLFTKSSTKSTWAGKALKFLAGSSFISGNLLSAFLFEYIIQSAEGNLDEWYYTIPAAVISDAEDVALDPVIKPIAWTNEQIEKINRCIFSPIENFIKIDIFSSALNSCLSSISDFAKATKLFTITGIIGLIIKTFFNEPEADALAEGIIEEIVTQSDRYNLSRNCLSLYMWNGFTRSWMPLKWMIEIYDRYTKYGNYPTIFSTVSKIADKIKDNRDLQDNYLYTIFPKELVNDEVLLAKDESARQAVSEYRTLFSNYSSSRDLETLERDLSQFTQKYYKISNSLERSDFMRYFVFDPSCVEAFQCRSPLNKLQTIATAAGNAWSNSTPNCRWLENWGMWISLPNEKSKIKLYSQGSFQLINRPYSDFRENNEVMRGNIHINIGHPCFMRGNDDVLWMAYWLRWTSPPIISTRKNKKWGITVSKTTTAKGVADISDKDIENWTSIINAMFQKHDDYGFEDWMINGNYGLSYSKFTIDEESPTAVSSYEESELNPLKAPMVNSVDHINKNQLVMRLSDSTVVNREDKNAMSHVAKRWV